MDGDLFYLLFIVQQRLPADFGFFKKGKTYFMEFRKCKKKDKYTFNSEDDDVYFNGV